MKYFLGIVGLILFIIGGVFLFNRSEPNQEQKDDIVDVVYDQSPPFSLEDYSGAMVNSSDFSGKIMVVNSWATWCPFCVKELDAFAELQEKFSEDIVVIAIGRSESLLQSKKFTDNLDITDRMTFLLDPKDSFYKSIGGFSMPETIFVDGSGNIHLHKRGPMELPEMIEIINRIITNSS